MTKDLNDLLLDELHDILSSEEQIVDAMPDMVEAAESPDLKKAFASHLEETKNQVKRLGAVFKLLNAERKEKFCKGTKGLIDECKEVLKEFKKPSTIRDAALISKAQRIEHYEISAYGTARTFAAELGHAEVAKLLRETEEEEGNADKKLTKISEGGLLKTGLLQKALQEEYSQESKKQKTTAKK